MDDDQVVTKTCWFETGKRRGPDLSGLVIDKNSPGQETEENIRPNNEFALTFFLTRNGQLPEDNLVIIVNGFNEMQATAYHNRKRGLCSLLAKRGCASVLIPIPNHMNRWPKDAPYPPGWEPKHLVQANRDRFYDGYRQEVADIEKLTGMLRGGTGNPATFSDGSLISDHLPRNIKIHLLGYSIGGLATLSTLVSAYYKMMNGEGENPYDSCVLLCSGANFQTLHPEEVIGLSEDEWKRIKHHYLGKAYEKEEERKGLYNRIFEMVLLGGRAEEFHQVLRELSNRILIVIGANDDVSSPEAVFDLEPEETGLAILKVPSLQHPFTTEGWIRWREWMLDSIASFLVTHSERVVRDSRYFAAAIRRATNKAIAAITTRDEGKGGMGAQENRRKVELEKLLKAIETWGLD